MRDVRTETMSHQEYEPPQIKDPVVGALENMLDRGDSGIEHGQAGQKSSYHKSFLPKYNNLHALLVKNILKLKRLKISA